MPGELTDTYVAALQHDLVDLPEGARRLGVVRKPTAWFHGVVDDNRRALAPPEALLDEFDARQTELAERGVCDEEAHNAAWDEVSFGARYRDYLDGDAAQAAIADVLERLDDGESVALVCYENTDQKRCHRTILRERLAKHLERPT